MSIEHDFKAAVSAILQSGKDFSHENKLALYGYFIQAKQGDCKADKPSSSSNILAHQKWQAWKSNTGLSKTAAMEKYIELTHNLLNPRSHSIRPPALPPLRSFVNMSLRKNKGKKGKKVKAEEDSDDDPPELPQLPKSGFDIADKSARAEMFRSRHFSSVAGLANPLAGKEDIAERYELYERIRKFYQKVDPIRVTKGLGAIVEWTLENGVDKLNQNLKRKYGKDLEMIEGLESKKIQEIKDEDRKRRTSQIALSRRLVANQDPETRQKLDKLTRFLLVNDPELVSRGMYLMVKFIEAKGIGALNANLKKNYGKSLDGVSDEELNAELQKKYGNDLEMLERPLFGDVADVEPDATTTETLQQTLKQQIKNISPEKLRGTTASGEVPADRKTNAEKGNQKKVENKKEESKKDESKKEKVLTKSNSTLNKIKSTITKQKAKSPRATEDSDFNMRTMDLKSPVHLKQFESRLKKFLARYEPNRLDTAFELMTDFTKKEGVDNLNKKLRKKYGVDLKNFDKLPIQSTKAELSEEEFNLKLMQFVNKHEAAKNIERALKAMTGYKIKHGIDALNTKLYMKYGETLDDVSNEENKLENNIRGPSIAEMHTTELPQDLLEKLRSYYAKYDPMVLASNGVERIFQWAERNGEQALDKQLKTKYNESLSEYIQTETNLKKELEEFYEQVDKAKLKQGFESVLAWALINGRDALNFNLRRKYNRDLDSTTVGMNNELPDM